MNNMDEYYMLEAEKVAQESKDPHTKVGALIVSDDGKELSSGYNDMPKGVKEGTFTWNKTSDNNLETKYPFVVHAECNALCNYNGDKRLLESSTMYVTLFPCNECAKQIVNHGIKKLVYNCDKYHNEESAIAARMIFDAVGVEYYQVVVDKDKIRKRNS